MGSKPLAVTEIVPALAGTPSKANAPEGSVVVCPEYEPALSFTCAPGTEAPLTSRTAPSTRIPCASTRGTHTTPHSKNSPTYRRDRSKILTHLALAETMHRIAAWP